MKRFVALSVIGIVILVVVLSGCAYHLHYSVKTETGMLTPFEQRERSFSIEQRTSPGSAEYRNESELLEIVARNLIDQGWRRVPGKDSAYVFQVEFGEEENNPKIGFGASFGSRSGFFLFGQMRSTSGEYRNQFIEITAFENGSERTFVWSADIRTSRVQQSLKTLASHMIPNALARFPQSGEWEVRERVHLNKKEE